MSLILWLELPFIKKKIKNVCSDNYKISLKTCHTQLNTDPGYKLDLLCIQCITCIKRSQQMVTHQQVPMQMIILKMGAIVATSKRPTSKLTGVAITPHSYTPSLCLRTTQLRLLFVCPSVSPNLAKIQNILINRVRVFILNLFCFT